MSLKKTYKTEIRFPMKEAEIVGRIAIGVVKGVATTTLGIGKAVRWSAKGIARMQENHSSQNRPLTDTRPGAAVEPDQPVKVADPVNMRANVEDTPCLEILRKAMDKAARDHRGKLTQTYKDHAGREHPSLTALCVPEFERGIGAVIDKSGRLSFMYDPTGFQNDMIQSLCNTICQNYAVIAVMQAQKRQGYNITAIEPEKPGPTNRVRISSVRA